MNENIVYLLIGLGITLFMLLYFRVSRIERKVDVAIPSHMSLKAALSRRCPTCGCINTSNYFCGMMIDVCLNGADAIKCEVCGSVMIRNKKFLEDLAMLNDHEAMYYHVGRVMRQMIINSREDDHNVIRAMVEWSMNYTEHKDTMLSEYIPDVVKRVKASGYADINDRVEYVVLSDFHDSFRKKSELQEVE